MYAAMNDLIARAARNQYAVLAINCFNLESARAAVKAAEEQRAPPDPECLSGAQPPFPARCRRAVGSGAGSECQRADRAGA